MGQLIDNPPAPVPVTLAELKAWLRVTVPADDASLTASLAAATEVAERYTGRALVERTVREVVAAAGGWQRLTLAPVRAVTAVEGLPAEGSAFPLSVGSHAVEIDARGEGRVIVSQPGAAGRAVVTYRAGMASAAAGVPADVRHGILLLAAHVHGVRDGRTGDPPSAIVSLWQPWRRVRL